MAQMPMAVVSGSSHANVGRRYGRLVCELFLAVLTADDGLPPETRSPICSWKRRARIGIEPCYCQVFEDADAGLEPPAAPASLATDVRRSWAVIDGWIRRGKPRARLHERLPRSVINPTVQGLRYSCRDPLNRSSGSIRGSRPRNATSWLKRRP